MLGDSVVGVKHCMDPRGGKITRATWAMFGVGAACLVSSAIAFKTSVDTATYNRGKLDYITRVAKKPAHTFRPKTDGPGLDALMFGGRGLGRRGLTMGLARLRRERKSPYYRIGTAPGVEQPLQSAPSADFPLVAPSGDDFVFNFGAGIDGEMTVDGTTVPLAQLAATGRARPSMTTAGAIEVPIPANARIRARSGNTTFLVSAVGKPRAQTVPLWSMENRTMGYFAGSLAAHAAVWAFLQTVPMNAEGAHLDLASIEATDMRGGTIDRETPPPEDLKEQNDGNSGGSEGQGASMALDEGAAGNPNSQRADGHMQIKNNNKEPSLSREAAIEEARNAGILGSTSALSGGIASLTSQADFSSGFDGTDVLAPIFGGEGEGRGAFGGGVRGFGMGGGCSLPPCGVIGTGRYGTIGTGTKAGDGWGGPGTGNGGLRRHTSNVPPPTIGIPHTNGDLDKEIIRRYVKRSYEKIAYCYERKLMANPGIEGQMSVAFLIAPDGTVQSSNGAGFDGEVASCVAGVVKQIKFPRPSNGGPVQVNYPFTFHAVGR
ncbi:MAG: AgmX/PglI C-terminal domain-containing protein [Kofleriaceae bacterium]|nr:AgmX/PglI C-terminal domain-containing protein [Kofleriaceae bacterium]